MVELDLLYPVYGFAKHKGYPTAQHMQALQLHGPTVHHRNSFRPVREARDRLQATSAETVQGRLK